MRHIYGIYVCVIYVCVTCTVHTYASYMHMWYIRRRRVLSWANGAACGVFMWACECVDVLMCSGEKDRYLKRQTDMWRERQTDKGGRDSNARDLTLELNMKWQSAVHVWRPLRFGICAPLNVQNGQRMPWATHTREARCHSISMRRRRRKCHELEEFKPGSVCTLWRSVPQRSVG